MIVGPQEAKRLPGKVAINDKRVNESSYENDNLLMADLGDGG